MTCLIALNLFYIIIEIFNIKSLVTSIIPEYEKDFINVLNKHAPIKSRYQRKNPLPCMNQELRRAVYRKQMLYSQFTKCNVMAVTDTCWNIL
jgi:predicted nucleic acid-binding OB-fold protein